MTNEISTHVVATQDKRLPASVTDEMSLSTLPVILAGIYGHSKGSRRWGEQAWKGYDPGVISSPCFLLEYPLVFQTRVWPLVLRYGSWHSVKLISPQQEARYSWGCLKPLVLLRYLYYVDMLSIRKFKSAKWSGSYSLGSERLEEFKIEFNRATNTQQASLRKSRIHLTIFIPCTIQGLHGLSILPFSESPPKILTTSSCDTRLTLIASVAGVFRASIALQGKFRWRNMQG